MGNLIKYPLTGPVVGKVIPLTLTAGELSLPTPVNYWVFNNMTKESGLLVPAAEAAAAGADDYLNWETNDWKKARYKITEETYEGSSGELVSDAEESGNVSQIDLVSNNLPVDTEASITDHADLLLAEELLRDAPSLVVIDLGKGYGAITRNNIGFALLWGYMTAERKVKADGRTPVTHQYTFKAESFTLDATDEALMIGIGWLGVATPEIGGSEVTFPDITAAALTRLKAGKWAIIK
jgi:hypothetical protein